MDSTNKITRRSVGLFYGILTIMIFILLPLHTVGAEAADDYYKTDLEGDKDSMSVTNDYLDKPVELAVKKAGEKENKIDPTTTDDSEFVGAGVNAGTMTVIVLLVGITGVLLYSFGFKKKK